MLLANNIMVTLVIILHGYFLVLEMLLWTKPMGLKVFGQTKEQAKATALLAANQGLYNGFLALGLFWGLIHPSHLTGQDLQCFFLMCVIAAGVYGGYSVSKKIIYIQALPAAIALALNLLLQFQEAV